MEIGKPERKIRIVPVEEPVPTPLPMPEPAEAPATEPEPAAVEAQRKGQSPLSVISTRRRVAG